MQRLGLAFLVSTLVIGATGSASAGETRDETAVRALGDTFANALVPKNAELRASLFAEDGTFVTPVGDFLQGRVAMVKDFGPEAEQAVNGTTQAAFSNYRIRFIKPDVAVVDALLTVRNPAATRGARAADSPPRVATAAWLRYRPNMWLQYATRILVADIQRGENILVDESDGVVRILGTNGISKFHLH